MSQVRVVDYNTAWPLQFAELHGRIWPAVSDFAIAIEHVGSTAVADLAAKPVIDLDVIVESPSDLPRVAARLAPLGYAHLGDLGIPDRDAFRTRDNQPAHHLYACPQGSLALRNHLTFRDHLRNHPEDAARYSALKKDLALRFVDDIDRYVTGKTEFILSILAAYGFEPERLDAIRLLNSIPLE